MDQHDSEEHTEGISGDEEEATETGVVMAVSFAKNALGIAVFDSVTREIQAIQVQEELSSGVYPFQFLQFVKAIAAPDLILAPLRADPALLRALEAPDESSETASGRPPASFPVQREKASVFGHGEALQRLDSILTPTLPVGLSPAEKRQHLGSSLQLGLVQQVEAVGALLHYILKTDQNCPSEADRALAALHAAPPTAAIVLPAPPLEMSLQGLLYVDPPTLRALQIFRAEAHPSLMGVGKAKEGLSLFGLLDRCLTPQGRKLLRAWLFKPLIDLPTIADRLDTQSLLLAHPEASPSLLKCLRKVRDAGATLLRLRRSAPAATAGITRLLGSLSGSLDALLALRDCVGQIKEELERGGAGPLPRVFAKVLGHCGGGVAAARALLGEVLDPSQAAEGFAVRPGLVPELDDLKQLYCGLPDLLSALVDREMQRIPRVLLQRTQGQIWSMVYLPQVGFCLQIEGSRLPEDLLDALPDYALLFNAPAPSGTAANCGYFACDATRQLNEDLGDVRLKILDFEHAVLSGLIERISAHGPDLARATAAAAELDVLLSLATVAAELNLTRPTLVQENVLEIQGGRHPLLDLLVASYVPNDTWIKSGSSRVHVILGPNQSGKTCYVKAAALIVFLAHVGAFVPAERARVGICDRIFARLGAPREVEGASSLLADLQQVAGMLALSTSRSLLILDEFGKGTLASDGVGLLAATIRHLTRAPCPPRTLLCTHFSEITDPRVVPRAPMLDFFTMAVLERGTGAKAAAAGSLPEELVFLYRVQPGVASASFGIYCARQAGVGAAVIDRAVQLAAWRAAGRPVPPMTAAIDADIDREGDGTAHAVLGARESRREGAMRAVVGALLELDCLTGRVGAFLEGAWLRDLEGAMEAMEGADDREGGRQGGGPRESGLGGKLKGGGAGGGTSRGSHDSAGPDST